MKRTFHNTDKYRESARYVLFYASNWMSALTAIFAVLLIVIGTVIVTDSVFSVLSSLHPLPDGMRILLHAVQFLLLSPLGTGLLCYFTDLFRAAHGDGQMHVPPSVIFSPYASARAILRAWGQILFALPLLAAIPASFLPLIYAGEHLQSTQTLTVPVLLGLCCIIAFLSVLYFNARLLPALFLSSVCPELSFGHAVRITWRASKSTVLTGVLLWLGFLAASVLSLLLTAGIVFFFYVLPVSVFTYIGYCHELSRRCETL